MFNRKVLFYSILSVSVLTHPLSASNQEADFLEKKPAVVEIVAAKVEIGEAQEQRLAGYSKKDVQDKNDVMANYYGLINKPSYGYTNDSVVHQKIETFLDSMNPLQAAETIKAYEEKPMEFLGAAGVTNPDYSGYVTNFYNYYCVPNKIFKVDMTEDNKVEIVNAAQTILQKRLNHILSYYSLAHYKAKAMVLGKETFLMPDGRGLVVFSEKDGTHSAQLIFGGAAAADMLDAKNWWSVNSSWLSGTYQCHGGFYNVFEGIWDKTYTNIHSYAKAKGIKVADMKFDIVGHSMGAAMSNFAALRLAVKTFEEKSELVQQNMSVITYGGLRIFNTALARYYNKLGLGDVTLRVSHVNDAITDIFPLRGGRWHVGTFLQLPEPIGLEKHLYHKQPAYSMCVRMEYDLKETPSDHNSWSLQHISGRTVSIVNVGVRAALQSHKAKELVEDSLAQLDKTEKELAVETFVLIEDLSEVKE